MWGGDTTDQALKILITRQVHNQGHQANMEASNINWTGKCYFMYMVRVGGGTGSLVEGRLNPLRAGTELTPFNYVNIMVADALTPYVARTSAAMILTI